MFSTTLVLFETHLAKFHLYILAKMKQNKYPIKRTNSENCCKVSNGIKVHVPKAEVET